MLWDGQRSPGSHQVVTGVMRETAGLAQSTGGTDTEQRWREKDQERKEKAEQLEAGLFRETETDSHF